MIAWPISFPLMPRVLGASSAPFAVKPRSRYKHSVRDFKLPRRGHFFAARSAKKRSYFPPQKSDFRGRSAARDEGGPTGGGPAGAVWARRLRRGQSGAGTFGSCIAALFLSGSTAMMSVSMGMVSALCAGGSRPGARVAVISLIRRFNRPVPANYFPVFCLGNWPGKCLIENDIFTRVRAETGLFACIFPSNREIWRFLCSRA